MGGLSLKGEGLKCGRTKLTSCSTSWLVPWRAFQDRGWDASMLERVGVSEEVEGKGRSVPSAEVRGTGRSVPSAEASGCFTAPMSSETREQTCQNSH